MNATSPLPPYRFNAGRWVSGPAFLGRTELLLSALSCLREPQQYHARRFLGRRRQGKTSFLHAVELLARALNDWEALLDQPKVGDISDALDLHQFAAACAQAGLMERSPGSEVLVLPSYIDLRAHRRANEVASRIAFAAQRPLGLSGLTKEVRASSDPLDTLLEALADAQSERPFLLVLLADEARGLAPTADELRATPELAREVSETTQLLRQLTEQHDVPLQLYISSTRGLDICASPELKRMLDSVPVFPLGNLSEPAVEAMFERSGLEAEARDRLRRPAAGNPFFLHVLGFAAQNPGANADPQITAGIENDLEHLTPEERAWLSGLAQGTPRPQPSSAALLGRCGYVQAQPDGSWGLREPLLERYLAGRPAPSTGAAAPRVAPNPSAVPEIPSQNPDAPVPVDLGRYTWPSRQRFGQLKVDGMGPVNLGAQCYILLHLLAECRVRGMRLTIQQEDAKYALYLVLAICGIDHGYLNPRGLLSGVRSSIKDALDARSLDAARAEAVNRWLPRGRGGYKLGNLTEVMKSEHPLGHLELPPLDLVGVYRHWQEQRAAFLAFLKDSAINHTRGLSLEVRLRAASDNLFPRHEHVLHLAVLGQPSDRPPVRLGPIPINTEQTLAFRHWKRMHMDEGWVRTGALERHTRASGGEVARVTDICQPLEMLSLRGAPFTKGQKRSSSEWMPSPSVARDFPTAPRWLDLHLVEDKSAPPYDAPDLLRDLDT